MGISPAAFLRCLRSNNILLSVAEEAALLDCLDIERWEIIYSCPLLMPYWLSLCVLRRTCRQNRLYETLFHTVIILSKHHHLHINLNEGIHI
jgi:hypothetical protein